MDLDNTILDFDAAERESFKKIIELSGLNYRDELLQIYKEINSGLWNRLEQGKIKKADVLNTRFYEFFKILGK
jgi:2-haloacid dehalogenase